MSDSLNNAAIKLLKFYYEQKINFIEKSEWTKIKNALSFAKERVVEIEGEIVRKNIENNINENIKENIQVNKITKKNNLCDCETLDDLKVFIENFEDCDLKYMSINTVFSKGNCNSGIMLIGEAPGAEEDEQGMPFVGKSGKLLDKMINSLRIDINSVYITNVVPWRPPGNRAPTTKEISICMPFLMKHIEIVRPKVIVLLGAVASKAVLNTSDSISKIRGQIFQYNYSNKLNCETNDTSRDTSINNTPIVPTFHPAYLLRSPQQKIFWWMDFVKALTIIQ